MNRDLSRTIIVDNSPSSYIFHPENAIDCSSFIDDPADVELDQIARFLVGVKNVVDVRSVCGLWRDWPNVNMKMIEFEEQVHVDDGNSGNGNDKNNTTKNTARTAQSDASDLETSLAETRVQNSRGRRRYRQQQQQ